MITFEHKGVKYYTRNSINSLDEMTDTVCLFSHADGNNNDCRFLMEWKDLKALLNKDDILAQYAKEIGEMSDEKFNESIDKFYKVIKNETK